MNGERVDGWQMKYKIEHADGTPVDPAGIYFVLKLNSKDIVHGKACRAAARRYARQIRPYLPQLTRDLDRMCDAIGDGNMAPPAPKADCARHGIEQPPAEFKALNEASLTNAELRTLEVPAVPPAAEATDASGADNFNVPCTNCGRIFDCTKEGKTRLADIFCSKECADEYDSLLPARDLTPDLAVLPVNGVAPVAEEGRDMSEKTADEEWTCPVGHRKSNPGAHCPHCAAIVQNKPAARPAGREE